jgi:CubicO group peptidase (beta-lactamase class C family)
VSERASAEEAGLDAFVAAEVRALGHPGVAVAVVTREKVALARGFGTRDMRRADAPVAADTVFRIGSITKVVSGIALLVLRDAGKLSLDDPVSTWLPEARALFQPVTLRELVTHTSGLPKDVPAGGTSEAELAAKLRWVKLDATPGTRVSYSNFGMALVGPIVHAVSGEPFRDFVRERVLAPLGMTSAAWERSEVPSDRLATGHAVVRDGGRARLEPERGEWKMGAAESFGGLYASVEDMARLVRWELGAWDQGPDEPGPIARASLRESQSPQAPGPAKTGRPTFGVCWKLEDDAALGLRVAHTGSTEEYAASVQMAPKRGLGVVVLSNAPYPMDVEAVALLILKKAAR